jgi:hypothetical protein
MRKKTMKSAAIAALAGTLLGGGCFGFANSWWGRILWDGALDIAWDYVLDNDAVYDLVEDGNV